MILKSIQTQNDMERIRQIPRADWRDRLNQQGFTFHSIDENGEDQSATTDKFLYWREDVAYRFTETQIETLYAAANELHAMSMTLAGELVSRGDLGRLHLSPFAQSLVEASWRNQDPHLYGRFDLSWNGQGAPKMLEYNADTPTSIIESAIAQWYWKEDRHPQLDQFNFLHEALVGRWKSIAAAKGIRRVHLAGLFDSQEDVGNLEYMMDVVLQAGLEASMVDVTAIGLTADGKFVDEEDRPIEACFKLYPWEWLAEDEFARAIPGAGTQWLEPAWKMILSNKALLPLLWERFKGHPNLLPAYTSAEAFAREYAGQPFVKKPVFSREGANVSFVHNGMTTLATEGAYGAEGFIYQAFAPVPGFFAPEPTSCHGPQDAMYAVIGAWVVEDEACGICIREDVSPVTKNTSYFVPHYFTPGV